MSLRLRLLVAIVAVQFLGFDCGSRKKEKNRYSGLDAGYVMLDECDPPADDCFMDCYNRSASVTCNGCCFDQRFLCDTKQVHDWGQCKGVP